MKRLLLLLIFIISILSGCKKEYIGPEIIITAKRTYYNGSGAVLPYRNEQIDTLDKVYFSKEQMDKINKSFDTLNKLKDREL